MPRLFSTVALLLALSPGMLFAQSDSSPTIGAFAFGDKGEAARIAVDVERSLRGFIHTTGLYRNVELSEILDQGSPANREKAIGDAQSLMEQGKADYEQLDLEKAQAKFLQAVKKLEYGYGYLRDPSLLLECTLHLGATWALVGEPEKASKVFMNAHGLPGPKVLDPNLFPPNIQDIFNQAMQQAEKAPIGTVKLITAPLGARVYVGGRYRGVTPITVKRLRAGTHMVRFVKDGYRPWGGKITVDAGKARSLKMKLKPTSRHKSFERYFGNLAGEAIKRKPGSAAQSLAGFIDASYLAVVVIQGQPRALKLRGYHCEIGDEFKIASHQEVLDATDESFSEKLSGYFGALLATTPEAPTEELAAGDVSYEAAEGEAAAADLLAKAESGEAEGADGYGLDLADSSDSAGEASDQEVASAEKPDETSGDKTPQETALDESLKDAKKDDGKSEETSTWGYLSSRWWFWTAVGVVVAGAATGTYFLIGSEEEEGGSLILGLH